MSRFLFCVIYRWNELLWLGSDLWIFLGFHAFRILATALSDTCGHPLCLSRLHISLAAGIPPLL